MNANHQNNKTSRSLIYRATQDDPEAWNRIVDLYSPLVYFWCRDSGLAPADLQDVFQEVFHAVYRNLHRYREIENGSFRGWLRTLTRNKLNDQFRKREKAVCAAGGTEALRYFEQLPDKSTSTSSRTDSNSVATERMVTHELLRRALKNIQGRFSSKTWQAFWKVAVDGRETGDVATELGMRPGTVRVAKSRVLKQLRMELSESIE